MFAGEWFETHVVSPLDRAVRGWYKSGMAFTLRPSAETQAVWEAAAAEQGRSLANWIERVCNEAANQRSGVPDGRRDSLEAAIAASPVPVVRGSEIAAPLAGGDGGGGRVAPVQVSGSPPASGGKEFRGPDPRSK